VSLNDRIAAELDLLAAQRILDDAQVARLKERYPTGRWDLVALARWLTILGTVAAAAGVVLIAAELEARRTLLELTLAATTIGAIELGRRLGRRGLPRTHAALELGGSFALQGLTVELAVHYASGAHEWPLLVGVQAALAGALAYALANRLILVQALVTAFVFFGGETGYSSAWGAYWLGLTYPVRFLAIGLATLPVALLHARAARATHRGFARVYLHFGLLVAHLACWFLTVFGHFGELLSGHASDGERAAFALAWAAFSTGGIWVGSRIGLGTLRAYGLTFLVIDAYTSYFEFIAASSLEVWWIHLLLAGGTLFALAVRLERRRRG
jgi:hypothetical protein